MEIAEQLRQRVTAAAERLRTLSEPHVSFKRAPETWSKKEILGHLIDSAANNHQRFVRAQLEPELRFPAYAQEDWARSQGYASSDWRLLVDLWRLYNEHLANIIARIPAERLGTRCRIGQAEPVTLGFLVEDYLRHMDHHLRQLDRD